MRWLAECSVEALDDALRTIAPRLSGQPIVLPDLVGKDDPVWWSSSAVLAGRFVVKFAWSRPAAHRLAHEIRVLTTLLRGSGVPSLPEVVVSSTDPVLLVTRLVHGASLFEVVDTIDRDRAGEQLARFLAALHGPATRRHVERLTGELHAPRPQSWCEDLPLRLQRWVRPDQRETVRQWCAWADAVLARPGSTVLAHGDLHGDNQVWDHDRLRVVVDFETFGVAEPEYELRVLPGIGPGVELLTATMRHYRQAAGRDLSVERVMAWHVRTALNDALWRSEANISLPDHRTAPDWVDDLATRFRELGVHTTTGTTTRHSHMPR